MNEKLSGIIDAYKDEMLLTLKSWLAIPSVQDKAEEGAPYGREVRNMLNKALDDCAKMGFEVKDIDGRAMHAQMGKGEKTLGILCHLDVVPAGEGWTKDPWGGEIADGKIYGRGTADDKGQAVAALYAMKAVREAGLPLKDGVRLILGCDEETGMSDMEYYRANCDLPDYGFSPDAEYPVINIEKGGVNMSLIARGRNEENAEIPVYSLYAGERCNVVPGKAVAVLGVKNKEALQNKLNAAIKKTGFDAEAVFAGDKCTLTVTGLSAHASMPELGKNAAMMLLILLAEIGAGACPGIAEVSRALGLEGNGESLGIAFKDEESGALTCNAGLLRYDGNELNVTLDIRYPLCAKEELILGRAAVRLAGSGVSVRFNGGHAPHYVPGDHKVVKGLIKAYSDVTGKQGYAFAIGGGTYSRCMPNTVAFGPNFPGDTDMCHMPDEYVGIDRLLESCKIMAAAICELAGC